MSKNAARSVHSRAVVVSGVRGVPLGRSDRFGKVPWVPKVPKLLQVSAPSPATPIYVVGRAPRVVPVPFQVPPPWAEGLAGLVTGRWPLEYYLKESNSVSDYTLKYRRHEQPGRCPVQLNIHEIQTNE